MKTRKKAALSVALLAASAWLAGCSGDGSPQGTTTTPTQSDAEFISVRSIKGKAPGTVWIIEGAVFKDDSGGSRMCDTVLESDPPQCGTPEIQLLSLSDDVPFTDVDLDYREPMSELRLRVKLESPETAQVLEVLEVTSIEELESPPTE